MGRFAPLPDAGRALRGAAAAGRAGALRGAAVRRLADDGAAGFRPAAFVVAPFADAPLAAEVLADALLAGAFFAGVLFADEPAEPDGFFGAALPLPDGVVPFAPVEPAPEPAREVDDGRAPEPRAEPEGRAGRREEGMG